MLFLLELNIGYLDTIKTLYDNVKSLYPDSMVRFVVILSALGGTAELACGGTKQSHIICSVSQFP